MRGSAPCTRAEGDGQQPLHEAATIAIADLLLDRGADVDTRCIDHKSTAAQYALAERPEICRRLLERGASADIFMPARLGDVALATRVLDSDPQAITARVTSRLCAGATDHIIADARLRSVTHDGP